MFKNIMELTKRFIYHSINCITLVHYATRGGRSPFLWSAMSAEQDRRRVLQIARDKKCVHPRCILYFLQHMHENHVFSNIESGLGVTVF